MRLPFVSLVFALVLGSLIDSSAQQSSVTPGLDLAIPNSPPTSDAPCNAMVLEIIRQMPREGGYSIHKAALDNLSSSVELKTSPLSTGLGLMPEKAVPSFCSGATYLVFLGIVQELLSRKQIQLSADDLKLLLIKGQADGEGVWGRWNANGPGTARLFYELSLGANFQSLALAKPGDFLKLFWNDQIGAKEFGHSVIFLGVRATPDGGMIRFWSSNLNVGYSEKEVPLVKVKRMLFSRLLHPTALQSVSQLPKKDAYLGSMTTNSSTEEQMSAMVGASPLTGEDGIQPKAIR